MNKCSLVALTLVLIHAGCASLRETDRPVSTPDPSIPSADITVEVEELPGLFQVTEQR